MNFRSSTPQSDTDQSDDDEDDDISDHDLTPCKICLYIFFVSLPVCLQNFLISGNPSPNMPGYNWGLGRIPDQDDIEEGLYLQYTFNYIFWSTVYICTFHYLGNFVLILFFSGWRNHVQKVNDEANNQTILMSFVSFGKLFDELKSKTCVITQDSVVQLSREKSGNIFNPNLVTTITEQLQ